MTGIAWMAKSDAKRSSFRELVDWCSPSNLFMLSRAIIAFSQLTIYLFTPFPYLTAQVGGVSHVEHCAGALEIWNLVCSGLPDLVIQALMCSALLLVISGFLPRVTGVIHLYIAICTSTGLTHVDGGEAAAVVVLTWIAVICLFDGRLNAWRATSSAVDSDLVFPWWAGIPRAAAIALKVQCSIIYFHSATAKFGTDAWVDGSALYYVIRMDMFGVSDFFAPIALAVTSVPALSFGLTVGVIVGEIVIAVAIWFSGRLRYVALLISVPLHLGIIAIIGIASFGMIMIGLVLAAVVSANFAQGLGVRRIRS